MAAIIRFPQVGHRGTFNGIYLYLRLHLLPVARLRLLETAFKYVKSLDRMTVESVCSTLIAARRLCDELFDFLSEQHDLVSGVTASDCAGFGPTFAFPRRPSRSKAMPTRSRCASF